MADHDDSDWDQAIRELLGDPASQARLLSVEGLITPDDAARPEGWLPAVLRNWGDVHTYLSRGHEPLAKASVWQTLEDTFDQASNSGEYVLIAHSLGSIVSGYLIGFGFIEPPKVLVTVGSQLGWSALLTFGWLSQFHVNGTWINLIDRDDPSAGFFSRDKTPADNGFTADSYLDVWVENLHPSNDHDFVGYMSTSDAIEHVRPLL